MGLARRRRRHGVGLEQTPIESIAHRLGALVQVRACCARGGQSALPYGVAGSGEALAGLPERM